LCINAGGAVVSVAVREVVSGVPSREGTTPFFVKE